MEYSLLGKKVLIGCYPTTILMSLPGTTIIFLGVFPSSHFAEFSWASTVFSISSRGASAGNSRLNRTFPLNDTA